MGTFHHDRQRSGAKGRRRPHYFAAPPARRSVQQERADAAAREAAEKQKAADARARAAQSAAQRAEEANARHEADQRALADAARVQADAARAQADAEDPPKPAGERRSGTSPYAGPKTRRINYANSCCNSSTPFCPLVKLHAASSSTCKMFCSTPANTTSNQPLAKRLPKISGIGVSHPGLNLQIEGYTDSTGTAELNQKLSEQRANAVRDYLMNQGLNTNGLSAVGYGLNYPVAPNHTAAGRKLNRRVELVVLRLTASSWAYHPAKPRRRPKSLFPFRRSAKLFFAHYYVFDRVNPRRWVSSVRSLFQPLPSLKDRCQLRRRIIRDDL